MAFCITQQYWAVGRQRINIITHSQLANFQQKLRNAMTIIILCFQYLNSKSPGCDIIASFIGSMLTQPWVNTLLIDLCTSKEIPMHKCVVVYIYIALIPA